jgi:hypothetical protein
VSVGCEPGGGVVLVPVPVGALVTVTVPVIPSW